MSACTGRVGMLLLGTLAAVAPVACSGVTHNPSYSFQLFPFGDIEYTHAKPPGRAYFTDFDPHACKLVVRPLQSCSPARTQHVLIATIYDGKGQPRRNRRVEWLVEGAGNIVEVDESGFFPGRGYKVDNKYAVSYTDYFEHRLTRGTDNPNDDFVIRPGQSWCVITSAVEGDTHVTVYAPEIASWPESRVFVTHHWVNAQWTPPAAASCPAGSEHVFTTNLFRPTDSQPLANYRVRYRIVDGPPAVLLPARSQEFVAVSDLRGNASVGIAQLAPGAGTNRVAVEVIRAPDPTAPSDAGIVIGRLETHVDWLAPAVSLNLEGPPSATVGQEAAYSVAVNNTGGLPTKGLTVRYAIPEGFRYVRSDPPALVEDNQLIWTLGELRAGRTKALQAVFKATRPDQASSKATVVTEEGLRAERALTTLVTQPGLKLAMSGPAGASLGAPITYQLTVTNPGSGPAAGVLLRASFDEGLEAASKANPVELRLDAPLGPGQTRTVPLQLTPRRAGNLVARVEAKADGGLADKAAHAVQVQEARLELGIVGPTVRYSGRPATWDLAVTNPGEVELTNVVLRDALPPELEFVSATEGGQFIGREVVWNIGRMKAGQRRNFQVTANCVALSSAAVSRAVVTGETAAEGEAAGATVRAEAEAPIEVRGLPAFRLNVTDRDDPLEVGGRTVYTIEVTNQGTLRGSQVQVVATLPSQMRFEGAGGPAEYKVDGQKVTFAAKDGMEPQATWVYTVEVTAEKPGDARFQVELRSATLSEPVVVQQSTTVYAAGGEPPLPGRR